MEITRTLEEALSKTIAGPGGARERFVNYDETERVLRLEYTGPVLLRRRNVQIQVEKDGRVILGKVVTPGVLSKTI